VLFFSLESRVAVASFFLTVTLWNRPWAWVLPSLISVAVFYMLCLLDHRALAQYRHDRYTFGQLPLATPPASGTKEE
jgi:hypothetical protein